MSYTLNDKGFAKWMTDNLPESLFSEYYKVYQNEIKTELIRNLEDPAGNRDEQSDNFDVHCY